MPDKASGDYDASPLPETDNDQLNNLPLVAVNWDRPYIQWASYLFFVLGQRPNHHISSSHFITVLVIVSESLTTNLFDNAKDAMVSF